MPASEDVAAYYNNRDIYNKTKRERIIKFFNKLVPTTAKLSVFQLTKLNLLTSLEVQYFIDQFIVACGKNVCIYYFLF